MFWRAAAISAEISMFTNAIRRRGPLPRKSECLSLLSCRRELFCGKLNVYQCHKASTPATAKFSAFVNVMSRRDPIRASPDIYQCPPQPTPITPKISIFITVIVPPGAVLRKTQCLSMPSGVDARDQPAPPCPETCNLQLATCNKPSTFNQLATCNHQEAF